MSTVHRHSSQAEAAPEFLTVEEAARVMRIGRTKAYALTRQWRATSGKVGIPVVDIGVLRVPRRQLEELLGVEILVVPGAGDAETPVVPEELPAPSDVVPPEQPGPELAVATPRRPRRRTKSNSDQQSLPLG